MYENDERSVVAHIFGLEVYPKTCCFAQKRLVTHVITLYVALVATFNFILRSLQNASVPDWKPWQLSTSVARWLSHKPAKSHHEKLLDPAKKHVTNFQQKSAYNSEILLKKLHEVFKINL